MSIRSGFGYKYSCSQLSFNRSAVHANILSHNT